jgi:membrane protease YdiL (CAAX protease family)
MAEGIAARISAGVGVTMTVCLLTVLARRHVFTWWGPQAVALTATLTAVATAVALGDGHALLNQSHLRGPAGPWVVAVAAVAAVVVLFGKSMALQALPQANSVSLQVRPLEYTRFMPPGLMFPLAPASALIEEIEFRGVLMPLLTLLFTPLSGRTAAAWAAMVLAAAGFGAMHLNRNLIGRVDAMLTGVVYGAAVLITGSLLVAICAHAMANVLAVVSAWVLLRQAEGQAEPRGEQEASAS